MSTVAVTEQNFESMVDKPGLLLLEFWAQWCEPCKAFGQIYQEVSFQYPNATFGKIDVESEPKLTSDFAVRSIPMLFVLKNREIIYQESGHMPRDHLIEIIEKSKTLNES